MLSIQGIGKSKQRAFIDFNENNMLPRTRMLIKRHPPLFIGKESSELANSCQNLPMRHRKATQGWQTMSLENLGGGGIKIIAQPRRWQCVGVSKHSPGCPVYLIISHNGILYRDRVLFFSSLLCMRPLRRQRGTARIKTCYILPGGSRFQSKIEFLRPRGKVTKPAIRGLLAPRH